MQTKCSQIVARKQPECLQTHCCQNVAIIQPECSRNVLRIQSEYSQNIVRIQSECSQNVVKMQSKCSQNEVRMSSEFSQSQIDQIRSSMERSSSQLYVDGMGWDRMVIISTSLCHISFCMLPYFAILHRVATRAHNLCHDNRQLFVLAIKCHHLASKNNCN